MSSIVDFSSVSVTSPAVDGGGALGLPTEWNEPQVLVRHLGGYPSAAGWVFQTAQDGERPTPPQMSAWGSHAGHHKSVHWEIDPSSNSETDLVETARDSRAAKTTLGL